MKAQNPSQLRFRVARSALSDTRETSRSRAQSARVTVAWRRGLSGPARLQACIDKSVRSERSSNAYAPAASHAQAHVVRSVRMNGPPKPPANFSGLRSEHVASSMGPLTGFSISLPAVEIGWLVT